MTNLVGPSAVEYEASDKPPNDFYASPPCVHCGKSIGYHWQTANGRIWCTVEYPDLPTANPEGKS